MKSPVILQGRSRGLRAIPDVVSFERRPKSGRSVEREIHQIAEMKLEHQDPEDWEAPLYPDRRCYQIPKEWVD